MIKEHFLEQFYFQHFILKFYLTLQFEDLYWFSCRVFLLSWFLLILLFYLNFTEVQNLTFISLQTPKKSIWISLSKTLSSQIASLNTWSPKSKEKSNIFLFLTTLLLGNNVNILLLNKCQDRRSEHLLLANLTFSSQIFEQYGTEESIMHFILLL